MDLKYNVINYITVKVCTVWINYRFLHLLTILSLFADKHLCHYCHLRSNGGYIHVLSIDVCLQLKMEL